MKSRFLMSFRAITLLAALACPMHLWAQRDNITDLGSGTPPSVTSDAAATSGPSVSLSPTSLTFSVQAIGTTGAAEPVWLKNTGTASLWIYKIAITGTNAGDFAQTHTCGSSLAAGGTCTISVTFRPTASGGRTATLTLTDNAAGTPQTVSLTGTGSATSLSPTSLNFGAVSVGQTSPPKTVTLTNVGKTTFTIYSIVIAGTNAGDFAQTHTCGSTLTAGASCRISVTFTPKPNSSGLRMAVLSVSDSADYGSPRQTALSGSGEFPNCAWSGAECYLLRPCCPGLVCRPEGNRAFCVK